MHESTENTAQIAPTWMVSARNGQYVREASGTSAWVPFGLQHARQVGSATTACGLASFEWQIFWELRFPAERGPSCPDCKRIVALAAHGITKFANLR